MQNSKRLLSLIVLLIFVSSLSFGLGRLLTPVNFAEYFNHDIKKILENNEEVEMIIVGDSRVYSSMNPKIFEDKMGYKNVIDVSSSSQPINGSYYLIKDMIERIKPQRIVLAVDCDMLQEDFKIQSMLLSMDMMSLKNKLLMWKNNFYGRDMFYLFNIYRYRENLDYIFEYLKERETLKQNDYKADQSEDTYYAYKGYIYRDGYIEEGNSPIQSKTTFDESEFIDINVEYLNKCVQICKENDVELIIISAPTNLMRMFYVDNYAKAVEYYENFCKENDLIYYNLNYLKDREIFLPDALMLDYNHTNAKGAIVVSDIFADILLKHDKGEDVANYFYQNYDEFEKSITRVVAVDAKIEKNNDDVHFYLRSMHSKYIEAVYSIEYTASIYLLCILLK